LVFDAEACHPLVEAGDTMAFLEQRVEVEHVLDTLLCAKMEFVCNLEF
jgi:hypothetical protein